MAEPLAHRDLAADEEGREERVGDVRRRVEERLVQAHHPRRHHAHDEVDAVDRQAADEDADAHREPDGNGRQVGAQEPVEPRPEATEGSAHPLPTGGGGPHRARERAPVGGAGLG